MPKRIYLFSFLLTIALLFGDPFIEPATGTCENHLCQKVTLAVALQAGGPTQDQIVGWLCGSQPLKPQTVQVLVSGSTYGHGYWDFPYRPDQYSYAQALNDACYATFNFDRIGIGQSSKPPASSVTVNSNAEVVHQIVQALRAGQIGGIAFERVILVGHSLGSMISVVEASTYADVDGVILSGLSHTYGPGAVVFADALYPAQLDPRFSVQNLPLGYLTTRPGTRGPAFYYALGAEPEVIAVDEATKETVTEGETNSTNAYYSASQNIHVPVLVALGEFDSIFCGAVPCGQPGSATETESAFYAPDACLEIYVLPQAGHSLNLHWEAPEWFAEAQAWAGRRVGKSSLEPATQPCG